MKDQNQNWRYGVIALLGTSFTWFLHELAHWATSEVLGYQTIMTLNGTYPIVGKYDEVEHAMIIKIVGPLITILQAIFFYCLMQFQQMVNNLYPFLFVPFYMRFLAGVMNFIRLNDEGSVSEYLQIGVFTIPIFTSSVLFYLVYDVSRRNNLNWKFQVKTTILVMFFSTVLILADQLWKFRLL